jgi:hypothetical protein
LIVMRAERKAFGENFSAQGPPIRRVELEWGFRVIPTHCTAVEYFSDAFRLDPARRRRYEELGTSDYDLCCTKWLNFFVGWRARSLRIHRPAVQFTKRHIFLSFTTMVGDINTDARNLALAFTGLAAAAKSLSEWLEGGRDGGFTLYRRRRRRFRSSG